MALASAGPLPAAHLRFLLSLVLAPPGLGGGFHLDGGSLAEARERDRPPPSREEVAAFDRVGTPKGSGVLGRPEVVVPRLSAAVSVDGRLDDPGWERALRVQLPYEWFPGENRPAPVETEAWLAHDGDVLYVAFRALDPRPWEIRASLSDRDIPRQDDRVGIVLDPFRDQRRALHFWANPLGVPLDAVFAEQEGDVDFSWDGVWEARGRLTPEGYEVEMAIPLESFRSRRGVPGGGRWGITLLREYPRRVKHTLASHPTDRGRACTLCLMEAVELGGEASSRLTALELAPTVSSVRTDTRPRWPEGPFRSGNANTERGLTARWNPLPNLTLQGGVNPDFAQAEAGLTAWDLNRQFAIYYPEARVLFLDDQDLFRTPIRAVFSRTVADPAWVAKVTGKEGPHAFGLLLARDRINTVLLPGTQGARTGLLEGEVEGGVVRYRLDVGEGSTVGALFSYREGGDYLNRVWGVDGFVRVSSTNTFSLQYLQSRVDYPDAWASLHGQWPQARKGDALFLEGRHRSRHWTAEAALSRMGNDFRADGGYVPRVDLVSFRGSLARLRWGRPEDWYSFLRLGLGGARTQDLDGSLSDQELRFFAGFSGPWQSAGEVAVSFRNQVWVADPFGSEREGESFSMRGVVLDGEIHPSGLVSLYLRASAGGVVDAANGRKGSRYTLRPAAELRLAERLRLSFRHLYERLEHGGTWTYISNVTDVGSAYHLGLKTMVKGGFRLQDMDRHLAEYLAPVNPETLSLEAYLLLAHRVNAQTAFFAGYSAGALGILDPDRRRTPLTGNRRTLFLKVGYGWRP